MATRVPTIGPTAQPAANPAARGSGVAANPGYWSSAKNADGTLASPGAPLAPGVRPAPVDTSVVGTAPPWLRTESVDGFKGGPKVTLSNPSYDDLSPISTDYSGDAKRGADAAYAGATQYFDKDFAKSRVDLETQLQGQGFAVGSEGYKNELDRMERGQNAARENAGFAAQAVGHQQAGDLLMRALAARQNTVGERNNSADRLYNQSLGVAGLALGRGGQILGAQSAGGAASASRYATDANTQLSLRRLGLDQDTMDFNQMMGLTQSARGGVNMPNFGSPLPLDVGGAYGLANAQNNANLNRQASDRTAIYGLAGSGLGALGAYFGNNGY